MSQDFTVGRMMAYALEKAHTSSSKNTEFKNRRNEAIAEYMLEYCLQIQDITQALAEAYNAECPDSNGTSKGEPHSRQWKIAYKFNDDGDDEAASKKYPDIRLECAECDTIPLLLELKLDAQFTHHQENTTTYWSGKKNLIVVPQRRIKEVNAKAKNAPAMKAQKCRVVGWEDLIRKICGSLKNPPLPCLLQAVSGFAENAGLAISPALYRSTALSDRHVRASLSAAIGQLDGQLELLKAFTGARSKKAMKAGFATASGGAWVATADPRGGEWVLDIDAVEPKGSWPFWISHKPEGHPRIWFQLYKERSSCTEPTMWMPLLNAEVEYWTLVARNEVTASQSDIKEAAKLLDKISAKLAPVKTRDLDKRSVECLLNKLESVTGGVSSKETAKHLKTLTAIDITLGAMTKEVDGSLKGQPANALLTSMDGFAEAWQSILQLHKLFANATEGLYEQKATTTAFTGVDHTARFVKRGNDWCLEQWRQISDGRSVDGGGVPFIMLETIFQPPGANQPGDVKVEISYRTWSGASKNPSLLKKAKKKDFSKIADRLRGKIDKVVGDDGAALSTHVTNQAAAVLSIASCKFLPGDYAECFNHMIDKKWSDFRNECLEALKDFKPVVTDAIGLKNDGSGRVTFEPSLFIGLREGKPADWKDKAHELAGQHGQKFVRVTILNPKTEAPEGYSDSCQFDYAVPEPEMLHQIAQQFTDGKNTSQALGAWCDGQLIINTGMTEDGQQDPNNYYLGIVEVFGSAADGGRPMRTAAHLTESHTAFRPGALQVQVARCGPSSPK